MATKTKALVPTARRPARSGSDEWDEINAAIEHGSQIVAKLAFKIGDMFIRLRDRIGTKEFWKQADERCVWKRGTVSKFIGIASSPHLREVSHAKLPPSWDTLYGLARLPQAVLKEALASGEVGPQTKRQDVNRIKRATRRSRKDEGLALTQGEGLETFDQFLLGDCVEEIKKLPNRSVDLLLTDPPYGSPDNRPRSRQTGDRLLDRPMHDDDKDAPKNFGKMLAALEPKLAPDVHAYVFCHQHSYPAFRPYFEKVFDFHNLLVWKKGESGSGSESFYSRNFELIMFGTRRGTRPRPLLGERHPASVLEFPVDPAHDRDHATPKPVELLAFLIKQSTEKNDRVLDPFAGSGSTLEAATLTDRRYFGVEIDKDIYEVAYDKLAIIENDREPRRSD